MTPQFEQHHGDHLECKLDEIIRLLHKLNRKVNRLNPDFSKEDKQVKEAKSRIPPPSTSTQKGK